MMKKLGMTMAVFLLIFLPGCLGVYRLEKPIIHFQLRPDVETVPCSVRSKHVLKVMPVVVASPYSSTRLLYSPGNYKLEPSVHYRWITPPDTMIREYLIRALRESPIFGEVLKREGVIKADYVLETQVTRLECSETNRTPVAHFEAHIVLIRKKNKANPEPEICLKKSYNVVEEIPRSENPPDANDVVSSLNRALKKFVLLLEKDLCDYFSGNK